MIKKLLRVSHVQILKQIAFILFIAGCLPLAVNAKSSPPHTVTGEVTDSKKNPLQSVNVFIKGTTKGVATDANGRFTLNDVPNNGVSIFSYTGFTKQEIPVLYYFNL